MELLTRRHFLLGLGLGGLAGCYQFLKSSPYWPDDNRFFNSCLESQLPPSLAQHEVILSAFEGLDTRQVWDSHVHLIGAGDRSSGIWVNPRWQSFLNPWRYLQFHFYLNAACPLPELSIDEGYQARLRTLQWGSRLLLLAFDYAYQETGERLSNQSDFYIPNAYAAALHQQFPETFEWLASIHPYRQDSIEALEQAFANGARGVKWLPSVMGINPASPLCKPFYQALARLDLPLLCHAGKEAALNGMGLASYNNPLALRPALEHGVKVVIAHCASAGSSPDTDQGTHGPLVSNFQLFARLMESPRYEGLLFGDISAVTQVKHVKVALEALLTRQEWHSRLLYGSDYPLPAIVPVVSLKWLVANHYLTVVQAQVLSQLRQHNPLLFDFVLNRHVQAGGHRFRPEVFLTRSFWTGGRFWKVKSVL